MLHFLMVAFLLAMALSQMLICLIPWVCIYLGNKENYDRVKKLYDTLIRAIEESNSVISILATVAIILSLLGVLMLSAVSPFVLIIAASYSLYVGMGSSVFASIVLMVLFYSLYESIPVVIHSVKAQPDCACETCVKTREAQAQLKTEGISAILNKLMDKLEKAKGNVLTYGLPTIIYSWYFLYLVW